MNALHPPANFELDAIWNDFERDPEVWVGILTGTGDKAFSAGNDLRFTAEHGRDMIRMADSGFGGLTNRTPDWKPIIAAVNGYALGGGFEMALACDIIIAADHARLGLPEPRVGLMAGAGGVHRLPRMTPEDRHGLHPHRPPHDGAGGASAGRGQRGRPPRPAHDHRARLGNEILACAPLSIRASKQAAMMGGSQPLDVALKLGFTRPSACGAPRTPSRARAPSREAQAERKAR